MDNGGDVRTCTNKGRTALDMARALGMSEIVIFLKSCGKGCFIFVSHNHNFYAMLSIILLYYVTDNINTIIETCTIYFWIENRERKN
mgnify:CR=1 FL=1